MDVPLKAGDVVADYNVESIAGVGGMAVVAVASHRVQRHRVAIKMLLPGNAKSVQVVKRFEREQRTLSQLHSDHTLRIYGAGQDGDLPYMLVEYLEGDDLAELLKREGPLPIELAVEYILQACHAIAEAHALGITHRDLKPSNLFLTRRHDGSPCIKVLDFGISKVSSSGDEPELTKTTHIMGSPFYMSPEQMISSKDVDHRTDIWALGVTLYELLTKALPFAAETPTAVCRRIMADAPTPLCKLRPLYPRGLEEIIERCLQRRPAARFGNIADLATSLADFGPPHARHAVESIYRLVEPSEPAAQAHLVDEEEPSTSAGVVGADTTLYLQGAGEPRSSMGGWWALGLALVMFGAGVGVGWVAGLPTDPTQGGAFVPAVPPAPAPSSARTPTAAPTQPAGERPVTASPDPIDLDEPRAKGGTEASPPPRAEPVAAASASAPPGKEPRPPAGAAPVPTLDEPLEHPTGRTTATPTSPPVKAPSASAPTPKTPPPAPTPSGVVF